MDERIEAIGALVTTTAYVAVCVAMLLLVWPGARAGARRFGDRQVYAWRRGLWEARRAPTPRWVALTARDDLPPEI